MENKQLYRPIYGVAQGGKMINCHNPILPGFYPDPSICRVGKDYYLVNSSFSYVPAIPIFHSTNLVQWEQIGNVLERESQVCLENCEHSGGIYAPTIRYHKGTFYVITTNISAGGNFLVTAKDPRGPWSEPHFLGDEAEGIDPSIFFDDDTCWYIGQRENSLGSRYFGDCEIWIQQLNIEKFCLEGESYAVLNGFQKNAVWPEGPHLYKKDGFYYILHAEGGTEKNHSIMIARSRDIKGPYEYCPANPIMTHRHLGKTAKITCVGHGDITDDAFGNWYMVLLGCRPYKGYSLLGRETFLAKVGWEDGWPVVNPGIGMIQDIVTIPGQILEKEKLEKCVYEFDKPVLPYEFISLRNPSNNAVMINSENNSVRLKMSSKTLKDAASPAYLALRQKHHKCLAETVMCIHPELEKDCAGLALVQSNSEHIRLECYIKDGKISVYTVSCFQSNDNIVDSYELPLQTACPKIILKIEILGLTANCYLNNGEKEICVAEDVDLCHLSTEKAGGFVGCTVGMFASANGNDSKGYAEFYRFSYTEIKN